MGTTQPIRDKKTLENFRNYYKKEENKPRNYALIVFGLNSALLMSIYNHSSYEITKRYLGIEQLDKDEVYENNVL